VLGPPLGHGKRRHRAGRPRPAVSIFRSSASPALPIMDQRQEAVRAEHRGHPDGAPEVGLFPTAIRIEHQVYSFFSGQGRSSCRCMRAHKYHPSCSIAPGWWWSAANIHDQMIRLHLCDGPRLFFGRSDEAGQWDGARTCPPGNYRVPPALAPAPCRKLRRRPLQMPVTVVEGTPRLPAVFSSHQAPFVPVEASTGGRTNDGPTTEPTGPGALAHRCSLPATPAGRRLPAASTASCGSAGGVVERDSLFFSTNGLGDLAL